VAQAWTDLPLDRPICIEGASADELALSIEPLPADAPAIITYAASRHIRPAQVVDTLLTQLDRIARELFPAWLPSAEPIESAAGAGAVAVRSIALRAAQEDEHHGAFLADLAERALRQHATTTRRFSPEVRATGLAKVIAASYGRSQTAILIGIPQDLSSENQHALVAGARWLTDCGGFGVWFTGAVMIAADPVEIIAFTPPAPDALLSSEADDTQGLIVGGVVDYPAVAGRPHPGSSSEQLLEAALRAVDWAAGREWNQMYQPHTLINPVKLDLLWRNERCIVEIDGAEHCRPTRFAADRQRDVLLQLAGYAVLRFTNQQVIRHRDLVLAQIQQFLTGRRAEDSKGAINA